MKEGVWAKNAFCSKKQIFVGKDKSIIHTQPHPNYLAAHIAKV